ncbi:MULTISPECIES: DUF6794 domain-containing protein [unclassified Paenibacillus]|uniref:DUF6794 domain-containing protein n=1 Tax=unclassified Paenibacillus TaxID=185978 RepID=UPI00020D7274|nr:MULTISPECIES: DUF6794 domain-containing protein [unclassified Paenibacillus]EGL17516.1 hypothetical protein HMPREF9413_5372 [Paenibacillus sp. HGF7]EPD81300.1 hypothetical protein HMPREF1207_05057 [Paenibacillus sp. HGH0039]
MKEAADHIVANDLNQETKDSLTHLDSSEIIKFHFTLGMYIRNKYEVDLDEADNFFPIHRDDVSFMVLEEIHRKLNESR